MSAANWNAALERIALRLGRRPGQAPPRRPARFAGSGSAPSPAQLAAEFCRELAAVGGDCRRCASRAELVQAWQQLLLQTGARSLVGHAAEELAPFGLGAREFEGLACGLWKAGQDDAAWRAQAAAADLGLAVAQAGIASSGSLFLCCSPLRPRGASLLPRVSVALLFERQLVPDLATAYALLEGHSELASSTLCITGPSRTSDIENDLTIGVHGPAAVHVFLLAEES